MKTHNLILGMLFFSTFLFSQECNKTRYTELKQIGVKSMSDKEYQEYSKLRNICEEITDTQSNNIPKYQSNYILGESLAGLAMGSLSALVIGGLGAWIGSGSNSLTGGLDGAVAGASIGYMIGVPIGILIVGESNNQNGSPAFAILASIIGGSLGILSGYLINRLYNDGTIYRGQNVGAAVQFILCPTGGVLGYNLGIRRY
jgi:hypothetical protein